MKTDKTIGTELNEIAPILASLKKENNEAIPAFYFSYAKENILEKVRQNEVFTELENIAPTLSALPKLQLNDVPATYFEHLPNTVFTTIQRGAKNRKTQPEKTGFFADFSIWIERVFAAPKLQMSLATLIAIVALTGIYSSFSTEAKNTQLLAEAKANLTKDDIQTYVIENSDEFDEL